MLGDEDGKVPGEISMKISPEIKGRVTESDGFDGSKSIYWQWNHNPVDSAWSLSERPGWLRLTTPRVVSNLYEAPNTISQRMEGPGGYAVVKLDVSGMKPGDIAGMAAFNGDSGLVSVECGDNGKSIVMSESSVVLEEPAHRVASTKDREVERVPLDNDEVYLKIDTDFNPGKDIARFYWSLDGQDWHRIGKDFKMIFDYRRLFMGTRYAIFNYATQTPGGYVDVDSFEIVKTID